MPEYWTTEEVEATVAEYFTMLQSELVGRPYNKSEHRRRLLAQLNDRSGSAVERKHMNISAVLRELGHPWIDGYKPYVNYQKLLFDIVVSHLYSDQTIGKIVREIVDNRPAVPIEIDETQVWVNPPVTDSSPTYVSDSTAWKPQPVGFIDYLAREAKNQAIGLAGEEFVLRIEDIRLRESGKKHLANRIEHVPTTQGDGLGYDILSFEDDGRERLIEVKTTSFGKRYPFFVTQNELQASRNLEAQYHLYRVFDFRKTPRVFSLQGALEKNLHLSPTQFVAKFPGSSRRM